MEITEIEKESLIKGAGKDGQMILTHHGFINNCRLTVAEIESLHDLAHRLNDTGTAVVINDRVFTPYFLSYNRGFALAGIRISKIIK